MQQCRWKYLYRAVDKDGATLDFYLADWRNAKAAKRFLSAALKRSRDWMPRVQHGQEPGLRRGDRRAEAGGRDPGRARASPG
jgi:transposase-like protein